MAGNSKADMKIHILYLVKHVPGVSYQQLMDKCLESLYMDFFDFSDAYNELIAGNLINKDIVDTGNGEVIGQNELLTITEAGDAVISDMEDLIIKKVKDYLVGAAADLAAIVESENRVKAIIDALPDGTFSVSLTSGDSGISITVKCASESEATKVADTWRSNSSHILSVLKENLLKTDN